jgi:hypothetical protein
MGDWRLSRTRASLFEPNRYPEKKKKSDVVFTFQGHIYCGKLSFFEGGIITTSVKVAES